MQEIQRSYLRIGMEREDKAFDERRIFFGNRFFGVEVFYADLADYLARTEARKVEHQMTYKGKLKLNIQDWNSRNNAEPASSAGVNKISSESIKFTKLT